MEVPFQQGRKARFCLKRSEPGPKRWQSHTMLSENQIQHLLWIYSKNGFKIDIYFNQKAKISGVKYKMW